MKIIVPIKQIARVVGDFDPLEGPAPTPASIRRELNEWDRFSLETALQIRAERGGEVVAVSADEPRCETALRTCIAMGADRAVRVWGDGLDGADAIAVAHVLAATLAREQPDLVLCGAQSSDYATAATGTALAELIGLPRVALVGALRVDPDGRGAEVERELEGESAELIRVRLPAVLTIQTSCTRPRQPNLRAIKLAESRRVEQVSLAELGLPAVDSLVAQRVAGLERPRSRGGEILAGDLPQVARGLLEIIDSRTQEHA